MPEDINLYIFIPILLFVLCALIVLIRSIVEPYLLDITREQFILPTKNTRPSEKASLKIAFFSDLHDKGCKVKTKKLVHGLLSDHPDLIIFGGDLCLHNKTPQKGLKILKEISDQARRLHIPCYAVRGNHDTMLSAQIFNAAGFNLLDDAFITIETKINTRFAIIGFNDSGKNPRVWSAIPSDIPKDIKPEHIIAVSHNPDIVYKYDSSDFAYLLSGHLHGGQIYMPLRLEHSLLRSDLLPKEGIVKGVYEKNGIKGYISRGCGCVIVPLRFLSKPQITHIHIIE